MQETGCDGLFLENKEITMLRTMFRYVSYSILIVGMSACSAQPTAEVKPAEKAPAPVAQSSGGWCSGVNIRMFVGGSEGDGFASIVLRGAQAAQADLNPNVEYIFSGWDSEKMISQLRDAVAAKPDGIAMMGHPGDDAILLLAEEASKAGILMMYQNVDVPKVRAAFGGGYVGAQLGPQGLALGAEAINQFGLKSGDTAILVADFAEGNRAIREISVMNAFEAAGITVIKVNSDRAWSADPALAVPVVTAAIAANPTTKVIAYPGGQLLGTAIQFMEAAGKKPGEIFNMGFDTSPLIIEGFTKGYIQLTSDQQPFLQGYVPVQSICLSKKYGFGPMSVDTGAGFVNVNNFKQVAEQATAGFR